MAIKGAAKAKRFVSIDFGRAFLKAAYLGQTEAGLTLFDYASWKNSPGSTKKEEAEGFINGFLGRNSAFGREAYLTISESVSIKQLTLPALSRDEAAEAIRWQLKSEGLADLEHSAFDWEITREYADAEGAKKHDVVCILAHQEIIDRCLSIAASCRLDAVKITSSHFNYASLLGHPAAAPATEAVLDIGGSESVLSIYKNNRLALVRNLSFSPDKFTQSITGILTTDKGKIELSFQAAQELKDAFGIPQDTSVILKDGIQAFHVLSLVRPLLESLKNEIRRSFDYFASRLKEEPPVMLYLAGGGAGIKNLDWYLSKELGIKAVKLSLPPFIGVELSDKGKSADDLSQILSAVGAPAAGSYGANLLPTEVKLKKIEALQKSFLRLAAIILLAISIFSLSVVKLQMHSYEERMRYARVHLDGIEDIKHLKEKEDLFKGLMNKVHISRVPVDGLLQSIAAATPHSMKLSELSLEQQNNSVVFKGAASGSKEKAERNLIDFIQKLEAKPFFKEVSLTSSRDAGGAIEFEIKCELIR